MPMKWTELFVYPEQISEFDLDKKKSHLLTYIYNTDAVKNIDKDFWRSQYLHLQIWWCCSKEGYNIGKELWFSQ